jgi:hypothetical protein
MKQAGSNIKIVLWHVMSTNIFCNEDGGKRFLQNAGTCLSNHMASYLRIL